MGRHSKWVFFPYATLDYKSAEAWLNQLAQEGWQAEKTVSFLNLVKLVRREGPAVCHCVDLCPPREPVEPGYLELCREAGWTPVGRVEQMRIFRSGPGERPLPIQTDGALELERFEKLYQRGALWSGLILLFSLCIAGVLLFQAFQASPYKYGNFVLELLRTPHVLIGWALMVVMLPVFAWHGICSLFYWRRARRAVAERHPLPVPGQKQARRRGGAWVFTTLLIRGGFLIILALQLCTIFSAATREGWDASYARAQPVVMAQDLGLPQDHRFFGEGSTSPLARYHSFQTLVDMSPPGKKPVYYELETQRYEAATPALARWIVHLLQVSTGAENATPDFRPVELGFEESWLWTWEPTEYSPLPHALLVLRQGNTAVLLQGKVDWTDPAIQDILWQRLALEPAPLS